MNEDLKAAIELYCSMLPYPNDGHQPLDDERLYSIYYQIVKSGEGLNVDFFKGELRKNKEAGLDNLNDEQFEEFAEGRIAEIDNARYILDRISTLI
jgi:hypothetical protein